MNAKIIRLLHPVLTEALGNGAVAKSHEVKADLFKLLEYAAEEHDIDDCERLLGKIRALMGHIKELEAEEWSERADDICDLLMDAGDLAEAHSNLTEASERLEINLVDLIIKVFEQSDLLPDE